MQSSANTPEEYMEHLPEDRKAAMHKLRDVIVKNLPEGFQEVMSYGMLGWVVPHSLYAPGYHCDPKLPLPYLSIASQKNFVAVYNMGLYADKNIYDWFVSEFPKHSQYKLDMGKSCIRFKKPDAIPFDLIGQLVAKMSPEQWVSLYESQLKR
jgi:hypothetical protein